MQVLLHGEVLVEAETAGHVTDVVAQLPEVAHHIEPEECHPAA